MTQTALILGASGRFGRHASVAFKSAGWTVQQFDRSRDDLGDAVGQADVVVNAWNPPDYTTWHKELLQIHQRVIDAARSHQTTLLVPGNVYVFGAGVEPPWSEHSPRLASNPLGRLRIEMEDRYRASGVKTILLRAGDFLDTEASGNWFDRIIAKPLKKGRIDYPGPLDVAHAWAFLPDVARAAVALTEKRHELAQFADIPFPGYTLTGREIAEILSTALSQNIGAARMNWWSLRLAAPFWPMLRGLLEMRYLWDTPHSLDGSQFAKVMPDFTGTPVERALAQAVKAT